MTWTDTQWEGFSALVEEAWPGEFDDNARQAWRVLLDQLDSRQATVGLRTMLLEGRRFRPSASEFIAAVHIDPSLPTFDEAWIIIRHAISSPGMGAARRDHFAKTGRAVIDEKTEAELRAAARDRALADAHPAVHRFVGLQGWDRLAGALDDEWGAARLGELRKAWQSMLEATDGRAIAVLASGDRPDGLRQLDPLATFGITAPRELAAGPTT